VLDELGRGDERRAHTPFAIGNESRSLVAGTQRTIQPARHYLLGLTLILERERAVHETAHSHFARFGIASFGPDSTFPRSLPHCHSAGPAL